MAYLKICGGNVAVNRKYSNEAVCEISMKVATWLKAERSESGVAAEKAGWRTAINKP
jgi:hypothetical protein